MTEILVKLKMRSKFVWCYCRNSFNKMSIKIWASMIFFDYLVQLLLRICKTNFLLGYLYQFYVAEGKYLITAHLILCKLFESQKFCGCRILIWHILTTSVDILLKSVTRCHRMVFLWLQTVRAIEHNCD